VRPLSLSCRNIGRVSGASNAWGDALQRPAPLDNSGVMPYALRFYLYLLVAGTFVLAIWLTPLGAVLNAVFCDNRCIPDDRHRAAGVWREESVEKEAEK